MLLSSEQINIKSRLESYLIVYSLCKQHLKHKKDLIQTKKPLRCPPLFRDNPKEAFEKLLLGVD
tara:strand:- start:260 stop:451 length:192 start_codon:yes stop_codon:yes gene_type:complete